MKILLLGAGGLLGRYLSREFSGHDLTALKHQQADITNTGQLDELFAASTATGKWAIGSSARVKRSAPSDSSDGSEDEERSQVALSTKGLDGVGRAPVHCRCCSVVRV